MPVTLTSNYFTHWMPVRKAQLGRRRLVNKPGSSSIRRASFRCSTMWTDCCMHARQRARWLLLLLVGCRICCCRLCCCCWQSCAHLYAARTFVRPTPSHTTCLDSCGWFDKPGCTWRHDCTCLGARLWHRLDYRNIDKVNILCVTVPLPLSFPGLLLLSFKSSSFALSYSFFFCFLKIACMYMQLYKTVNTVFITAWWKGLLCCYCCKKRPFVSAFKMYFRKETKRDLNFKS